MGQTQRKKPVRTNDAPSSLADVIQRNIRALVERRRTDDREKNFEERVADAISYFTGSLRFVYLHVVVFGTWIAYNRGVFGGTPFDPNFSIIAMIASIEAIFLSTFVLIAQNRMSALADKRADLDVQISLLAEHEVTRLVQLVSAIADRMGIAGANDPELDELKRDVAPEVVLEHIERTERELESPDDNDEGLGEDGTDRVGKDR